MRRCLQHGQHERRTNRRIAKALKRQKFWRKFYNVRSNNTKRRRAFTMDDLMKMRQPPNA